jgi:Ca2+-binding EF-hand superfamily protein
MNELAKRLKTDLMPRALNSPIISWENLFNHYDKDGNGELTISEVQSMMKNCGYHAITDAECRFVLNNMSGFKP